VTDGAVTEAGVTVDDPAIDPDGETTDDEVDLSKVTVTAFDEEGAGAADIKATDDTGGGSEAAAAGDAGNAADNKTEPQKPSGSKDAAASAPKAPASSAPAKEADKPGPEPTPVPSEEAGDITVTVGADCRTLAEKSPALAEKLSDNGVILAGASVTLKSGASPLDALKASGVSFAGKTYISSLGGLSEKDVGPKSGWVYSVNGKYPGVGVALYKLKDGDVLQFRYTLNGGADVKAVMP
jgi:hypothetical protein